MLALASTSYHRLTGHATITDIQIGLIINRCSYNVRIARMLGYNYGQGDDKDNGRYVDAAKSCRDVRKRMKLDQCSAVVSIDECVYNTLLPLLDTLQRRAYEELRLNTDVVVGTRVPTEVNFLIFEHLLDAEEIPRDPRVFVDAKHHWTGEKARKIRLACPHIERSKRFNNLGRPTERFNIRDDCYLLACGDNWNQTELQFAHFDDDLRRQQSKKYCITNEGVKWPWERKTEHLD